VSDAVDRKALRAVLAEARAEKVPELDVKRIEDELDALPPPAPPKPAPRFRLLLAPAALAAAAAIVYFAQPDETAPPADTPPTMAELGRPREGDQLAPGTVIAAATERRTVSHPGRVTWTLDPGSRVTLLTTGEMVTLRLDQGSVSAEVVPSARPESFAVEAGDLRVAVHGTVFRVALATNGIDVSVSEGSVLVGPRAKPGTGKLLQSPAAEHFDPPPAKPAPPPVRAPSPPAPASASQGAGAVPGREPSESEPTAAAAPTTATPELPPPSPGAVDTAALHVIELASACYRQRTAGGKHLPPVSTTLRLQTRPDGSISSVKFEPSLPRQVELCVRDGARSLHGPVSNKGIEVSRSIVLGN
jgi:hypothetical protein